MDKKSNKTTKDGSSSAIQTVLNNLHYARRSATEAEHALFVINMANSLSGYRKQHLAARMILDSYSRNPEFDGIRRTIDEAWAERCRQGASEDGEATV